MISYIAKTGSKTLVISTAYITDGMAVKFFPEVILLLKVDCFEGFLNRCKIDGIVNDNLCNCNSKWFFKNKKDDLPLCIYSILQYS